MTASSILFICIHNAGRSQMAEAFLSRRAEELGLNLKAVSAGTEAANAINPIAVTAMEEIGISMAGQHPKLLTQAMVDEADRVITMGCGVDAAACPARIHLSEDWGLDDPSGQPIEKVREIRDEIRRRVNELLDEISTPRPPSSLTNQSEEGGS